MARQHVFKGIINGVEFDNVNDYNKEMEKLLSEGATINASSQTSITESEETDNEEVKSESISFLPGFDTSRHYLDDYTFDDNDKFDISFNKLNEALDKSYDYISNEMTDMDICTAEFYKKEVEQIIQTLTVDTSSTDEAIKKVRDKLDTLLNYANVIDVYYNFYNTLKNDLTEHIDKLSEAEHKEESSNQATLIKQWIKSLIGDQIK